MISPLIVCVLGSSRITVIRYADLLVHRLVAVAVGADVTYPELLDRKAVQAGCNNLNYRHKMAQYAQRSSVALHTHLFFKHRVQDEDAYVLTVRQNALQVLIPKYGLEGSVYLKASGDGADSKAASGPDFVYNPDVRRGSLFSSLCNQAVAHVSETPFSSFLFYLPRHVACNDQKFMASPPFPSNEKRKKFT